MFINAQLTPSTSVHADMRTLLGRDHSLSLPRARCTDTVQLGFQYRQRVLDCSVMSLYVSIAGLQNTPDGSAEETSSCSE